MVVKVKKLSKELGIKSEELLEALRKLYVDVEDENSAVDEKIAALMKVKLGGRKPQKEEKEKSVKKPTKKTKIKKEAPGKKSEKTSSESDDGELEKPKDGSTKADEAVEPVVGGREGNESDSEKTDGQGGVRRLDKVVVVKHAGKKEEEVKKDRGIGKLKIVPGGKNEDEDREGGPKKGRKFTFSGGRQQKRSKDGVSQRPYFRKIKRIKRPLRAIKKPDIAHEEIKTYEGDEFKKIQLQIPTDIRSMAVKVNKRPNDLIQHLLKKGVLVSINQELDVSLVRDLLKDLGYELEVLKSIEDSLMEEHYEVDGSETEVRAPIVTFMGHVDHGKTSLLDYIRKTMVTAKEKGGITQHIGAYKVDTPGGSVTFLDTPGHEAFTAMRARGATATDVVVLVVAADDGVMPQTREAIHHARAAGVPVIVAINKCDLPGANVKKVKIELRKEDLVAEDYGGKTVMTEVSAKTGEGIDDLVEMLMLESELLELKANPALRARGMVIEAKKTSGQGVTATLLVQNGTLNAGDIVLTGVYYGRVKAMMNDCGVRIDKALPSTPVEILGLEGVPEAGDAFYVVKDEKKAKTLSALKQSERKKSKLLGSQRITLEDFHERFMDGDIKELKIILKADVQGSLEAITTSMNELSTDEVKVSFTHAMVGDISESDIMLAVVSNSVVIGFHVKTEPKAEMLAKSEKIDCRHYDVIYEAISDVKAAMEGLLEPFLQEAKQGTAQVKQIFSSKGTNAAGCMVTKGTIHRKDRARIRRGQEIIFDGTIAALRRFKDDVKDVREGFECGISIQGLNDIREGDIIEAYVIEKIARRLGSPKK
ncbi:MAG: translation initiation factor IF-2 [Candidatus Omnitrophica bacterium]|nr:translation initiation factor IF-2 [Candidatus Omnitrophota bacterium]MBU1128164.1 translation initiation factor IF-2 [Candidatus Omnitrophota bacterium]MBU1851477.1 translation initiation factor IF-2 [Candidatus Omnitrophota bacterium]